MGYYPQTQILVPSHSALTTYLLELSYLRQYFLQLLYTYYLGKTKCPFISLVIFLNTSTLFSITPSYGDETFRVGCVAKELKTLGEYYNVPVITAQQFNRNGNAIIDSAMRDEKSDLLRLVGSSDIGGAWTVVEEADFVCAINLERHKKENRLYLSFKCTKNRCGNIDKNASSYFNHPFANDQEMRLETDLDKEGSLSIMSLASDLESVDLEKLEEMSRPVIVKSTGASSVLSSIGINSAKAV